MTRRSITGIVAAVTLLAGGLAVCGPSRQRDGVATRWETAPATRGPIAARVSATGTLSPLVEVQVGSQVSGRIQELHADFNAPVTKGQVIARIDPRLFETEVARARANVCARRRCTRTSPRPTSVAWRPGWPSSSASMRIRPSAFAAT